MMVQQPMVGDPVSGRDGFRGTVAGTCPPAPGRPTTHILVRMSHLLGLRHTTRLVPIDWVRNSSDGGLGGAGTHRGSAARLVLLDASRAEVAGCPPLRPDGEILGDVRALLTPAGGPDQFPAVAATVHDGTVHFAGHAPSARPHKAIVAAAWNVPGVLGMVDDIVDDGAPVAPVAQARPQDSATTRARRQLGGVERNGALPPAAAQENAAVLAPDVSGGGAGQNAGGAAPPPIADPRPTADGGGAALVRPAVAAAAGTDGPAGRDAARTAPPDRDDAELRALKAAYPLGSLLRFRTYHPVIWPRDWRRQAERQDWGLRGGDLLAVIGYGATYCFPEALLTRRLRDGQSSMIFPQDVCRGAPGATLFDGGGPA